ncbi:MAG TPA: LacI family DNA-binding transcriptional regulator, partial [Casimicrobiaceae bacterium]|nr:LacI family DNA-binding transcriptional regulator [Casimicrobiaceae bacterium]
MRRRSTRARTPPSCAGRPARRRCRSSSNPSTDALLRKRRRARAGSDARLRREVTGVMLALTWRTGNKSGCSTRRRRPRACCRAAVWLVRAHRATPGGRVARARDAMMDDDTGRPPRARPRLREVADRARVSTMTVTRALHAPHKVADATRR